ncbi:MAG: serine/threonine-protein kinase [Myxococcota bacterium]
MNPTDDDSLRALFRRRLGEPSSPAQRRAKRRVIDEVVGRLEPIRIGDRYTLGVRLGAGGMGVVHQGHDTALDRQVAIKRVHSASSEVAVERLEREARTLAALNHPNIVTIHDVVRSDDEVHVVMELIDGCSLRHWLKQTRWGWAEIVDAFAQAGRGLAAAHAAGIIHRDFKLSNVMVTRDGVVKVIDFGLARAVDTVSIPTASESDPTRTSWTQGAGTLPYMAPEQRSGATVEASDQYGFCASLYTALVGKLPFGSDGPAGLHTEPQRRQLRSALARNGLPRALQAAVLQGLSADPADRFDSMHALLSVLQPRTPRWRTLGGFLLGGFLLGGFLLGGAALALRSGQHCAQAEVVSGVWSPDRLEQIEAGLRRTYAPEVAAGFRHALGRHVEQWHEEANGLCRVPTDQGSFPRRCLQQSLVRAELLVVALEEGTSKPPDPATRLAELVECDEGMWSVVGASERIFEGADAELMQRVQELFVRSLDGDYRAQVRMLEELLETHQPQGAVRVWALVQLAHALSLQGEPERAAARLQPALVEAETAGGPVLRGTAQAAAAAALAQLPGREAEALSLAQRAVAALNSKPEGAPHRPAAQGALAVAALRSKDPALAMAATRQGLNSLSTTVPGSMVERRARELARAELLNLQALALEDLGRLPEALVAGEKALASVERVVPGHLDHARILNNLGHLERKMARPERAAEHLERALVIKRTHGQHGSGAGSGAGSAAGSAAATAMNLGNLRQFTGQLEQAVARYVEAESLLPEDAPARLRAELAYNHAIALQGLERHEEALASYGEALARQARDPAVDPEVRYGAHLGRGLIHLQKRQLALARRDLGDARQVEPVGVVPSDALELRLALVLALDEGDSEIPVLEREIWSLVERTDSDRLAATLRVWHERFGNAGRGWPVTTPDG